MRLWHEALISHLPRQQLLGQHRECCALRGNGWGKPHSTVNYVFYHSPLLLFAYHQVIMKEMIARGYNVNERWLDPYHRGKSCEPYAKTQFAEEPSNPLTREKIYPEHDESYLQECLTNLKEKGIIVNLDPG
ncbi:hypothetical protein GH741_13695 [Aquibacillus halophilus]|uniref:Pyrimidine dimer DNA glycosylase n=1 Tax=Aquibacillus halophilus TaxID=930132 RepID=A0A6A8DGU0_9BACI|nr:hypothetical protein [Aquibacillus halophilus]